MQEQENFYHRNEISEKKDRPTAITVICVLGFIGGAIVIPMTFSKLARDIGSWYPPYLGLSGILGFICMLGLWNMKKWAVYIYTGFFIINQIVLMMMGLWSISAILMPGIVIGIAFSHLNKMD